MKLRSSLRRMGTISLVAVLSATLLSHIPAQADEPQRPEGQVDKLVSGTNVKDKRGSTGTTGKPYAPAVAAFPTGSATIDSASPGTRGKAKPDGVPVRIESPEGAVKRIKVDILDRAQTDRAKVPGIIMRLQPEGIQHGKTKLELDYSRFESAYGADWGSRLRLVAIPECALSTPDIALCQPVPLKSSNDSETKTLTGDVDLAPATTMMVGATAASSGAAGDLTATPLQASSTWSAGGNSGNFSWSYPMRVPPVAGGLAPQVSLSYSSQSVDGRMAASNNQPSWLGEGFDYQPGFIERQYKPCDKNVSGDLCQVTDNATLSLNGSSVELIYEEGKGWHGRSDDGSRIERNVGVANGDDNGEHWVVTTPAGVQYWFGLRPAANSTWTVPVKVGGSWTTRAWRWNLDFVVDPHGNTMSLQYQTETNNYARNASTTDLVSYVRGGWLSRIDYGTRSDSAVTAAAQVVFDVADRCITAGCGTHDAVNWPDVPWDQECTTGTCNVGSPTFWTTKRLSTVTTKLWNGSAYTDVERWTLQHTFPDPGDGTRAGLWLDRISHTGLAGTAVSLPDVTFSGIQLSNRVDTIDHSPAMNWWRIASIHTETGGRVNVNYSAADCVAGTNMPGAPESNNKRCYPVRWTPLGYTEPITDWFHKYVVSWVSESDDATGGERVLTKYEYVGDPAWHYTDDNGLIEAEEKTWSQWRGYGLVRTTVGDTAFPVVTDTSYFRGMHGDKLPSGTRSVQLPAAGGAPAANDEDAFAGMVREAVTAKGWTEESGQVTEPWQSAPTASRTINDSTVHSRFTGTGATHARTTLDDGRAPRTSTVRNTFDAYGMIVKTEDSGDNAVSGDERCVATIFEPRNPSAWIIGLPHSVQSLGADCGATPTEDNLISDVRTSYDGGTFGAAASKGDVTKVEVLKSIGGEYLTTGASTYDKWGRAIETFDLRGNKTVTAYTHNAGGQLSSTKVTNHLGWETSTTIEPAFGTAVSTVDPNGRVTEQSYDALGRLTAVWLPGRAKATESASMTYSYLVRNNAPTVVTSSALNPAGAYITSTSLYDGLLRVRQAQSPAANSTTVKNLVDTHYDSAGRAWKVNGPYSAAGTPGTDLFAANQGEIHTSNVTTFDRIGRPAASIYQPVGFEKWRTSYSYGGDRINVTPPAGGTATSTITDIQGRTVELRQYHDVNPSGSFDSTTYSFNRKGQQTQVKDSAGNTWTYAYDLMGRQTSVSDPDKGTTASTYNDVSEVTSTTDARGTTLAYVYDTLGRKVSTHDGSPAGPKWAEWVYDTLAKGKPTKSIRYDGANAYVSEVTGYSTGYQPLGSRITIPDAETGLGGTYNYSGDFLFDGSPNTATLPAAGGLPEEKLTFGYDAMGLPKSLKTNIAASGVAGANVNLVDITNYTGIGELTKIGHKYDTYKWMDTTFTYEDGTRRLKEIGTSKGIAPASVSILKYTFDAAGNVTSQAEAKVANAETQCYQYDYLRRMTQAWTPSSNDCAAAPSTALGGPAPYWTSWSFDKAGNRLSQVEHATDGTNTATNYTYGSGHQLASTSDGHSYTYDQAGNTATRDGKSLTWNEEGRLASYDGSSYLYDADGNRLIARDANGSTLYLPSQELRYTKSNGTKVGTRYYTHAGKTVAMRVGSVVTYLVGDHQGTTIATVAASDQAVNRRYQTPYGNARGTTPPVWANDKGFVGGTKDASGLTHLGAREYDPIVGRFISVDPVMDLSDPQQWNAYGYANGSPITNSDPTGLKPECGGGTGGYSCSNNVEKANGDGWFNGGQDTHYELTGEGLNQYNSVLDQIRENNSCQESFWCRNKGAIIGGVVGAVAGIGCTALTFGVGALACAAGAGALGSLVAGTINGNIDWSAALNGDANAWKSIAMQAAVGGIGGLVGFGIGAGISSALGAGASTTLSAGAQAGAGAATRTVSPLAIAAGPSAASPASAAVNAVAGRATMVASRTGVIVPTSASRLQAGLQAAVDAGESGFSTFPTRSAGVGYGLPGGETIRIMQPAGMAGLRASFEDARGIAISPFTGRQVSAPSGVLGSAARAYVRERTHVGLNP